jgi:hypothetical protein
MPAADSVAASRDARGYSGSKEMAMRCQDKKGKGKPKPGHFICRECSAVARKKKHLCKPKKIKKDQSV